MKKLIARIVFWGIPIAAIVACFFITPNPLLLYLVIIVPVAIAVGFLWIMASLMTWAYDILHPEEPQPDYEI